MIQYEEEREYFLRIKAEDSEELRQKWNFYPFYNRIRCYVLDCLKEAEIEVTVKNEIAVQIVEQTEWIFLRCLLKDLSEIKECQKLLGNNSEEEYRYYERVYLDNVIYVQKILEEYPVATEMLLRKIEGYINYVEEILIHIRDNQDIMKRTFGGEENYAISKFQIGMSDEHMLGKTVARITFENGVVAYHKPRSLRAEQEYETIYKIICKYFQMSYYERKIIDCGNYGWELEIEKKEKKRYERKEIENYYKKLGIQLAIAHVFAIKDLHIENLVVNEAEPIWIDLETFMGTSILRGNEFDSIRKIVDDSVFRSGMLPGELWGKQNIWTCALGSQNEEFMYIKSPSLVNGKTSDMRIEYKLPKWKYNPAIFTDEKTQYVASQFVEAVLEGFEYAYDYISFNKDGVKEKIGLTKMHRSRVLLRNTQVYKLYHLLLTYPELMKSKAKQVEFLQRLERGLPENGKEQILEYEIECCLQEVFPRYELCGKDLLLENGERISNYLEKTLEEEQEERFLKMSSKDKYRQMKMIVLSMFANVKKRDIQYFSSRQYGVVCDAHSILERILKDSECINGEYKWIIPSVTNQGNWILGEMGYYLYDGIAGILLYMEEYQYVYHNNRYNGVIANIKAQLFEYTRSKEENSNKVTKIGIINGEASILYTYLILYGLKGENEYLNYAKRHAQIIKEVYAQDTYYDVLEGTAGAVIGMLLLYDITKEYEYCIWAEEMADFLCEKAIKSGDGLGWKNERQSCILTGMAHGNIGMALAFARLWKATGKEKYKKIVEECVRYEELFYIEEEGNWRDLRDVKENNKNIVAWCTGATGELIARREINEIFKYEVTDEERMRRLEQCINEYKEERVCLCHGSLGNVLALDKREKTREWFQKNSVVRGDAAYQMAYMTGLSGIGSELLRLEYPELPCVLYMTT